jgi:peptide/nickel transport system substrate-binding protein
VADRLGQQLGNYRLVSLLGQGGYAEVYLGQHVRFNQQAAIKVLHAHLSHVEAEHFQQEAETIATLAHPSIIRVLDFDVQEGIPFLVIDYAPNGSLRQRYPKGSLVPLPVIVSSVKQVADALQYAHEQKFIHRDVKPENMLVGRRQEVLLSDFGIATIAHNTSSLNVGAEGTSGTLAYMAPEQIEGHPRPASDQYALGIVVYEWLCGERPFEGSVSEVMAQHLSVPPPSLRERIPTIPSQVEQVVLHALAKDPKARFASVVTFSAALEKASQRALTPTAQFASQQPAAGSAAATSYETVAVAPDQPVLPTETTPSADLPVGNLEPTVYPAPHGRDTPERGVEAETPQQGQVVAPTAAVVSPPLEPTMPVKQKARHLPRRSAALLIGLVIVIIAAGVLGSYSLLSHFGMIGAPSTAAVVHPMRGGTWTEDAYDPNSLLPNLGDGNWIDQALYLPLFYGDAQGFVHPGAAREIPNVGNGGISADATTWTFHLRPGLLWSDGAPYDARDVDYTWKLWLNPTFGAAFPNGTTGFEIIRSADVSADHLSITFHLTHAYAPFLSYWVDGFMAPLPAHHFSRMAPEAIAKSPDLLNPQVTSGPFMVAESLPGDHYTLVRNPRYYRASEGLPYLDKVVLRTGAADQNATLKELQAGTITAARALSVEASMVQAYRRLSNYRLVTAPTNGGFEALWFNFHNTVLASHPEVRQAIAMAIDHQALIQVARQGFATPLCTDHPSALHPGYEPGLSCVEFDPALANQLLDQNGWVKGADGVRAKGGQRLSFEYATCESCGPGRLAGEAILERDFKAIGIQLDIHNYPGDIFFGSLLPGGKASPPTGAIAGRYDIAEWGWTFGYDPDDSSVLSCDQIPPNGVNTTFYCNHALDALYTQELATADVGQRQQIFDQIHQIYLAQLPFITLYSPTILSIVRKGTHNYLPGPFSEDNVNMWEWWCDGGKC